MKQKSHFLKSERIIIRTLEQKHLESLRTLRNDPNTSFYLTTVTPISVPAQKRWFESQSLDNTKIYLSILTTDGTFVGLVRCDEWDKINLSIRIGIDIVPSERKKGLATEAYDLLLDYLFNQLNIHRIWLLVTDFNDGAFALYKKIGFAVEGSQRDAIYRDGAYHDYIMMSILKPEYEKTR